MPQEAAIHVMACIFGLQNSFFGWLVVWRLLYSWKCTGTRKFDFSKNDAQSTTTVPSTN